MKKIAITNFRTIDKFHLKISVPFQFSFHTSRVQVSFHIAIMELQSRLLQLFHRPYWNYEPVE